MTPKLKADDIVLQLAEARPTAFTKEGWGFELKYDGFRMLAERINGHVRLLLRRGRDASKQFPEIAQALSEIKGGDFILDGEVVIQDESGHPIFQRLLKRSTLTGPRDIAAAQRADPAVYFAFDLLMYDGIDLRDLPLKVRKQSLISQFQNGDRFLTVDLVETQGEALLQIVKAKGLEGIMCKRLDAPYRGGRSEAWYKVALKQIGDFAVVGYADDFGALYLATFNGNDFVYAGKVGSGFTPAIAKTVQAEFESTRLKKAPCIGDVPKEKEACWITPARVVEVRYKNWPVGLSVREPSFLRFRDDKLPQECPTPRGGYAPSSQEQSGNVVEQVEPQADVVGLRKFSNPNKILFPDDQITKGEVVKYYELIAPVMLKYLRDRPMLMTRYPDGITGKSFFQKQKPIGAPSFLRVVEAYNADEGRTLDQLVCDDEQSLHWCATMAALPIHIPAARAANMEFADWFNLDFDPKDAPFKSVIELALSLRELCESIGLPSFCKTSGSSGLHVFMPLGSNVPHAVAQQFAEILSVILVNRFPMLCTKERVVSKRNGKVYVDAGQNGSGKVIAAPYCIRAVPGAPVSMPVHWNEVPSLVSPRQFTIRNALQRLESVGDAFDGLLHAKVDMAHVFEKLANQS
jgi:bifunctional non-homologous end joining protein LigD